MILIIIVPLLILLIRHHIMNAFGTAVLRIHQLRQQEIVLLVVVRATVDALRVLHVAGSPYRQLSILKVRGGAHHRLNVLWK